MLSRVTVRSLYTATPRIVSTPLREAIEYSDKVRVGHFLRELTNIPEDELRDCRKLARTVQKGRKKHMTSMFKTREELPLALSTTALTGSGVFATIEFQSFIVAGVTAILGATSAYTWNIVHSSKEARRRSEAADEIVEMMEPREDPNKWQPGDFDLFEEPIPLRAQPTKNIREQE